MKRNKANGFTLIELLVVATIMIVLMTIGLVSYQQATRNSRNAKRKSDLESVRQALVMYHNDIEAYPNYPTEANPTTSGFNSMTTNEIADYLSTDAIEDPKNTDPYQYLYGSDSDNTFNLCAYLETDAGAEEYCLTNP